MNENEPKKDILKPKWNGGVARDNPVWISLAADRARARLAERKRKLQMRSSYVFIANVHFTMTDETYYVSSTESLYSSLYKTDSLEKTIVLLIADGWQHSGKVSRYDYVQVDMLEKNSDLIAIWEENNDG